MEIRNGYIKKLKKEELSFYGLPIQYTLKDYEKVLQDIINEANKYPEIKTIYKFGEVKAPGISDIDLIFVLKKEELPNLLKKNYIDNISKYLVFHPFLIFNEEIMKSIKYVYPESNYIKIYGDEIDIYNPSNEEKKKIKQYLNVDTALRHFPVDYLYILLSKSINVRMVLLRFNALTHTFRMFKDFSGIEKEEWKNFSAEVDFLRKKWFELEKDYRLEKLLELLKIAVYVSNDFIKELDNFLKKDKNNLPDIPPEPVLFKGYKNRISFKKNWSSDKAIDDIIVHFIKYKNFYSILPSSFLRQLCGYSSADGRLSRYIKKRLNISCFQKDLEPVLKKRIDNLNEEVELANKLKHSHYPCFFPLGYKTERGLRNKMILVFILITNSSVFRRFLFFFRAKKRQFNIIQ